MRTKTDTTTRAAADHVAVRLDDATRDRVDALIPSLSTDWHKANRSDVLRAVLLRGLPLVEADPMGTGGGPKRRRDRKA